MSLSLPNPYVVPKDLNDPLQIREALEGIQRNFDALRTGRGAVTSLLRSENWHEVGATGEPAFANSWVNFGATRKAGFYKDAFGIVRLTGVVKDGTAGLPIFVLPIGYRPDDDYRFLCKSNDGTTDNLTAIVSVDSAGQIFTRSGGNADLFLQTISFRVA